MKRGVAITRAIAASRAAGRQPRCHWRSPGPRAEETGLFKQVPRAGRPTIAHFVLRGQGGKKEKKFRYNGHEALA